MRSQVVVHTLCISYNILVKFTPMIQCQDFYIYGDGNLDSGDISTGGKSDRHLQFTFVKFTQFYFLMDHHLLH